MIEVSDGHENLLLGVLKPNLQDLWPSLNLFVSGNQFRIIPIQPMEAGYEQRAAISQSQPT
jgi:hypothetical protein